MNNRLTVLLGIIVTANLSNNLFGNIVRFQLDYDLDGIIYDD